MFKSLTVLFFASLAVHSTIALTGQDVIKITAGMIEGVVHKDDLNVLQNCFQDADSLTGDFQQMVTDFKTGGVSGLSNGIQVMAKILQELPNDLQTCQSIEDDLTKMGQWAEIFVHPVALMKRVSYNLLWHFSEINGDIQLALQDWDANKFYEFGEQVGETLVFATKA